MKNTLTESTLRKLVNYLIITGTTCNILVGINAVYINDYFLLSICLLLASTTCLGYLMSITNRAKVGANIMFSSYIIVFTCVSFTYLVSYPLILVFPMVIGLVNLFHQTWRIKSVYIIGCLIGCSICIVNTNFYTYGAIDYNHVINAILIGVGLIFAFIIITELHGGIIHSYQQELEDSKELIEKKNIDLKEYIKTNLQLENFAYLASHELKTPIKNISNFTQLLEKKLYGKLDSKEQELFEVLKMETWRMNEMMKDLLKLSQLSQRKMEFSRIHGDDFINGFLDKHFKDEMHLIEVNNFPKEFYAAETQLNLLFLNVIDNAFKFSDKGVALKIVIDCKVVKNEYIFSIKDNGIGIADAYKDRVFLIFKKLNGQESYKGSGIGLSMCREIVERHEGKIWIEDNQQGGTVIKFTISNKLNTGIKSNFNLNNNKAPSIELKHKSA